MPFFSCSIAWNWSSHWHWCLPCAAACLASRDIDGQLTVRKFRCSFKPFSVLPRQVTYWETNVRAGRTRIILHLKSVIWHCSATRFRDLQGGIKTLDDEYFGRRPICLICFICSDHVIHVWKQSYWIVLITRVSQIAISWRKFLWSLVESERDN